MISKCVIEGAIVMFDEVLLKKFTQCYEAGDTIFLESEPGHEMYIIKSGRVKVIKIKDCEEHLLSMLGQGSLFGEMALIEAKPRSATVVAMEKTEVLMVTFTDLEQILSSKPEFLYKLIQVFCRRIRFTSSQVQNFSIKSPSGKTADLLLMLAEDCKFDSREVTTVRLGVSAPDISQMTGLELREVNSILEKFVNEGLIVKNDDQSVSITNLNGLKSTRNFYIKKDNLSSTR
jgi:CRP-like cAMP-binding protein